MTAPRNKRPRRQKAADRILNGQLHKDQIMADYALAPFDRAAIEMDNVWGIDRLPELVSPATARKYGEAMALLNEAIDAADPALVQARAENCIRGLHVMNAEAEAAGKPKSRPDMLEYELDGFRFAVMPDSAHWPEIRKQRPDLVLFSLREVAIALIASRADNPVIRAAKDAFPKAEIFNLDTKVNKALAVEDELPF
jgi:hypothetical protein